MAKKKKNENTLQYLQMPIPQGGKYSKMTKISFGGLNKRYTIDSGDLSMESNISTNEFPYLTPSESRRSILSVYERPIAMYGFDDFLIVLYFELGESIADDAVKIDYIKEDGTIYKGLVKSGATMIEDEEPGSVVQFNVYDTPTDPLTGQFVKKLLFFPYKASMYMNIVDAKTDPRHWTYEELCQADLSVMYCYNYNGGKYYFTVNLVERTPEDEGYDENKVTYKRELRKKYTEGNCFKCDGMEFTVKEYYNAEAETDESGAEIYPPPDTASHECYHRNSFNNDVYRWCEYETEDGGTTHGWKVSIPPSMPNLKYATVHLSRVFGVDDDRVYASGYNDYTNWTLDTIDEYNEANAWCSPSQANSKAGGKFTGITTFQSHVVCFKHDFMHEIYNTKNPFRLQDIYAEGAIDHRSIQDVDGKLIFVSDDDVKIYTGSNPRVISYNLNMSKYRNAVSGTDNRNYYLYCTDENYDKHLYVYDTLTELWSEQSIDMGVINFAHNKNGMYMLCEDGNIYEMDTGSYNHNWSFETELITSQTVDIKHIKKLQMLVELNQNANMQVYVLYDNEVFSKNTSHLVYSSNKADDETLDDAKVVKAEIKRGRFPIRVKPRKTANYGFKLHFEGYGYAKLYELEIFIEAGGDMYV